HITYTVAAGTPAGSIEVALVPTATSVSDITGEALLITLANGSITVTAVPEPGSLILVGIAASAVLAARVRLRAPTAPRARRPPRRYAGWAGAPCRRVGPGWTGWRRREIGGISRRDSGHDSSMMPGSGPKCVEPCGSCAIGVVEAPLMIDSGPDAIDFLVRV